MKKKVSSEISFFEKYLTLWVLICMAAGVFIGRFLPFIPDFWDVLNMQMYQYPLQYSYG